MIKKNVSLHFPLKLSPWRTISIGSWRPTGDSSIHTMLEVDARAMLKYLKSLNAQTGAHITELQFIGLLLAKVIEKHPYMNKIIRFGRVYPRKNIDIFFHVALDKMTGENLTGIVIRRANTLSLKNFSIEFSSLLKKIKKNNDREFRKVKSIFKVLPAIFSKYLLNITSMFLYDFNIWSSLLAPPQDPFGSIQITNIGSLDIDNAFVPIAPYTRIPMVVAVGSIRKRAFVINEEVQAIPTVKLCFTFDHRLMEGVHFSKMQTTIKHFFKNPHELDKT